MRSRKGPFSASEIAASTSLVDAGRGPGRAACPSASSSASSSTASRTPACGGMSARTLRSNCRATLASLIMPACSNSAIAVLSAANSSAEGVSSGAIERVGMVHRARRSSSTLFTVCANADSRASVMRCAVRCEQRNSSTICSSDTPWRRVASIASRNRSCAFANAIRTLHDRFCHPPRVISDARSYSHEDNRWCAEALRL